MASCLCYLHDSDHVPNDYSTRWKKEGQDDWSSLPESDCTNWCLLLHEFDLRKLDIPILERFLHPDVEGRSITIFGVMAASNHTQAFTPVAVLVAGWALAIEKPDYSKLGKVSLIVIGVALASFGEIDFVMAGFLYQCAGIFFEAIRICMVQRLLQGDEFKMDPLVSLYYYAPACAAMNLTVALFMEVPKIQMAEVYAVGLWTFLANAGVAFLLNVSVVFLVRSLLPQNHPAKDITTNSDLDWQNLRPCPHSLRCSERYPPRRRLHPHLGNCHLWTSNVRLLHCHHWHALLQAWR